MLFKAKLKQREIKNKDVKALKKFDPYQIILAPIMTEKTYKDAEKLNKYFFKVHADANKNDVKASVNVLYGFLPKSVNICKVLEKGRSNRKLVRRAYKKAIITLKKGDKIELAS